MKTKKLKHPKWVRDTDCERFIFPDGEVIIKFPPKGHLTAAQGILMLERVKFHLLTLMEKS